MPTPAASTRSVSFQASDTTGVAVGKQNGAPLEGTEQQQIEGEDNSPSTEPAGGYPPQKHAGAVGLGPEYAKMHRAVRSIILQIQIF